MKLLQGSRQERNRGLSTHPKAGGLMKRNGGLPINKLSHTFNPPQGGRVDETERWSTHQ